MVWLRGEAGVHVSCEVKSFPTTTRNLFMQKRKIVLCEMRLVMQALPFNGSFHMWVSLIQTRIITWIMKYKIRFQSQEKMSFSFCSVRLGECPLRTLTGRSQTIKTVQGQWLEFILCLRHNCPYRTGYELSVCEKCLNLYDAWRCPAQNFKICPVIQ